MTPAELAKGALRRLAQARQEPTPENYARAWAEEACQPAPPDPRQAGSLWAGLIERVVRGLERSARQWTPARKKESLQRVLQGSARDAQRLQQRLQALLQAWETDAPDAPVGQASDGPASVAAAGPPAAASAAAGDGDDWPRVTRALQHTLQAALPAHEARAQELADELAVLADRLAAEGAGPALVSAVEDACTRAQRLLGHRHRLFDDVGQLCTALTEGLAGPVRGRELGPGPVRSLAGAAGRRRQRPRRACGHTNCWVRPSRSSGVCATNAGRPTAP